MEVLKVASNSNPNKVAGALAGVIREKGKAELQAIGAGAVNQAVKAIAIARGYLAPSRDQPCLRSRLCRSSDQRRNQNGNQVHCLPKRLNSDEKNERNPRKCGDFCFVSQCFHGVPEILCPSEQKQVCRESPSQLRSPRTLPRTDQVSKSLFHRRLRSFHLS